MTRDPRTGPIELIPVKAGWTASQKAGVITGGTLIAILIPLLCYGIGLIS